MIKDISVLLNAVGVGNCFLLSYTYLFKKQGSSLSVNHILSFLFFVLGMVILNTILNFSEYSLLFYGFEPLSNALAFAIAPLLLLYVRSLNKTEPNISLWSAHLLITYGFLTFTLVFLLFPSSALGQWSQLFVNNSWNTVFWNLHFLGYLFLLVIEFRKKIKSFSITTLLIVLGTVSIWLFNLLFFLYRIWVAPLPNIVYLNITLLFSLMTAYLFYKKFGVGGEAGGKRRIKRHNRIAGSDKTKDPILRAIREFKYYRNPELNIRTLSDQLQIPYHELSSWINQNYSQNFNSFINTFRIQEVVNALKNQKHQTHTIMGLAQQAGFKSASAFYAAFKKEMGTTPSEFLEQRPQ